MNFLKVIMFIFIVFSTFSVNASNIEVELNFGLILKNDVGEPVGFQLTNIIPIRSSGRESLYGAVVSNENNDTFLVGSVHIVPGKSEGTFNKFLGKQMKVKRKGGIFMKTQIGDRPGVYQMEVYIDNVYFQTIEYQLVDDISMINN